MPDLKNSYLVQHAEQVVLFACGLLFMFYCMLDMVHIPFIFQTESFKSIYLLSIFLVSRFFLFRTFSKASKPLGLLYAGLVWLGATSLLRGRDVLYQTLPAITQGMLTFEIFFPLPFLLTDENRKRFVRTICALWVSWFGVLALLGITAVMKQTIFYDFSAISYIGINPKTGRLYTLFYPTVSASYMVIAAVLAAIGATLCKSWPGRLLHLLPVIPISIALSYTDGRTGFILLVLGLFAVLFEILLPWIKQRHLLRIRVIVPTIAILLLTMVLFFVIMSALPGSSHRVVNARDLTLNGRTEIWTSAGHLLMDHPGIALIGTSEPQLFERILPYYDWTAVHLHNIFLQIFFETGIPGVVISLVFVVLLLRRCFPLLFNEKAALWHRLLPIPCLIILVNDMLECMLKLGFNYLQPMMLMLFAGLSWTAAR